MAVETTDATTIGGVVTGLVALPYIVYKVYQQLKTDQKGDTVDDKIQSFTKQLQDALEKVVARADALQVARDQLASENAQLEARVAIAEAESKRLREELDKIQPNTAIPSTGGTK